MKFNGDTTPLWASIIPLVLITVIGAAICVPLQKFLPKPLFGMLVGLVEI